jgi:hypothetical protein
LKLLKIGSSIIQSGKPADPTDNFRDNHYSASPPRPVPFSASPIYRNRTAQIFGSPSWKLCPDFSPSLAEMNQRLWTSRIFLCRRMLYRSMNAAPIRIIHPIVCRINDPVRKSGYWHQLHSAGASVPGAHFGGRQRASFARKLPPCFTINCFSIMTRTVLSRSFTDHPNYRIIQ